MKNMKKMIKNQLKRSFTLIELVVVVLILGILTAIVVPNISSLKEDAIPVAVASNERSLQTAIDMYGLSHNGQLPTVVRPTIEDPQPPDYSVLYPDYIKNKPEVGHYLIDVFGRVWGSTSVPPNQINYTSGEFSFKTVDTASEYEVSEYGETKNVESNVMNAVGKYKIKAFAKLPTEGQQAKDIYRVENPENKSLLVSAIDKYGLQTAPVGEAHLGLIDNLPIRGTGTFFVITDANGMAVWDGIQSHEILPEGTSIEYSFATADEDKKFGTNFVQDISALNVSRYLKVKVEMKSTNENKPTLKYLKVIFHLLNQEKDVMVHEPATPIILGATEKKKTFTEVIDLGSKKDMGDVELIGKEVGSGTGTATYQSSEDGVNYSVATPYFGELPDGRYVKVTAVIERVYTYQQSPSIEKIVINNSPNKKLTVGNVGTTASLDEATGDLSDWETIDQMTIVQDATEVGDWVSVQTEEVEPASTRMIYRLSTSNDENTWSATKDYSSSINLIPEMANSRFLKVEVIKQRKRGTNNSPDFQSITIDYNLLDGTAKSAIFGSSGLRIDSMEEGSGTKVDHVQVGQFLEYGKHYNGKTIQWQVVKVENGTAMITMQEPLRGANNALLQKPFDVSPNSGEPTDASRTQSGSNNWATSDIRQWLNNNFYNEAFTHQEIIQPTTNNYIIPNIDKADATSGTESHRREESTMDGYENYNTAYKGTTVDKIFYLSIEELYKYLRPLHGKGNEMYVPSTAYEYTLRDAIASSSKWVRTRKSMDTKMIDANYTYTSSVEQLGTYSTAIVAGMNIKTNLFQYGDGSKKNPYRIQKMKDYGYVEYGTFEGRPILWQAMKEEGGEYMLLAATPLKKADGTIYMRKFNSTSNNWELSEIKSWLNGEFLNSLPNNQLIKNRTYDYLLHASEQAKATSGTEAYYHPVSRTQMNINYANAYKTSATDKVRLPNILEVYNIFEPALGVYAFANGDYWLRDASQYGSGYSYVLGVNNSNTSQSEVKNVSSSSIYSGGVRPIIYIDKTSVIHGDGTFGTNTKPYLLK